MIKFNEDQRRVIEHKDGPALVLAGPGSGKTTVVTARIAALTKEHHVPPDAILAITFTDAAANEMRTRYLKYIAEDGNDGEKEGSSGDRQEQKDPHSQLGIPGESPHSGHFCSRSGSPDRYSRRNSIITGTKVTFGTFHSVFFRILREYVKDFKPRLAGSRESMAVLRELLEDPALSYGNEKSVGRPGAEGICGRLGAAGREGAESRVFAAGGAGAAAIVGSAGRMYAEDRTCTVERAGTSGRACSACGTGTSGRPDAMDRACSTGGAGAAGPVCNAGRAGAMGRAGAAGGAGAAVRAGAAGQFDFTGPVPGRSLSSDYLSVIRSDISRAKNGVSPRYALTSVLLPRYDRALHERGMIDFDDMLVLLLKLLRTDLRVLEELRRRYRYIIIDEFQDINFVQFEIMRLIAAPLNNLLVVGDDDQSIYVFRGASPKYMLEFEKYFPGARKILLGVNYRSNSSIVKASLRLISQNKTRYKKRLRAADRSLSRIDIRRFADDEDMAAAVIDAAAIPLTGRMDGKSVLFPEGPMLRLWERLREKSGRISLEWPDWLPSERHRQPPPEQPGRLLSEQSGKSLKERSVPARSIAVLYRTHKSASAALEIISRNKLIASCNIKYMTFHSSKGMEFDEVFIIAANEGTTPLPVRSREELAEERRMFYVAMTRARKKLHIFYTTRLFWRV